MAVKKEKEVKPKIDITKTEPLDKKTDAKKKEKTGSNTKRGNIKKTVDVIRKYNVTAVVMIALALFIFSFVIAAQLNTVGNTNIISEGMREADLLRELQNVKEEYDILKEQYEESQEIVEEYKTSSSSNDALIASMQSDLEKANVLAGLANVRGEGVVITLKDSTDTEMSVEAGLVHDTDITAIVTELKAAGAEAISINGQRVISTTAIRCVGPTIQVNSVKVASPFYIKAIGNSKYLESALNIKNGVVDSLKAYGIEVEIETDNSITIDKYDLALKLRYASEVK
ncbi:MAG: DUF881 domain-containing protein [Clostridia bacterium]|nr:DUF881 domain-containing protein [Clostridia bacterium]